MSRIDLQIVATGNFGALESQLARLKAQIASINAMGIGTNPAQLRSVQNYSSAFANALTASGMFQTRMVNLTSETEKFGKSLERGNLRLSQYFRSGAEYARKQQGQIRALAREQVRMMNSTTMSMGDGRAMVVTPKGIDEAVNKQKILNQEHRIFRQVVQGGATQLINWGKNTQWAGRQLTVGLTVPLTIFGAMAGKVFMDADKQLTRMAKVYGDASKGMVNEQELDAIRGKTLALAQEIASTMGVAVQETLGIAADIAATGKQGNELLDATREAMRLSVLGEVDRQEAMKATLAIQSVFKQDSEELANSINLLNAVENQTSTTLNDLVTGIIKAGPVVQGLGGDIADLASMMVAMREGGIPASEAANAIKSSLGGLINPTKQTTELLKGFGINLTDIVDRNAGDVIGTLMELQSALEGIDELSRQRAIEQMFGKFQFSRINALLNNLNKAGSQTEQVLKIAGMSTSQLAQTAERELKLLTESSSMRFTRALESLKASLIPIGQTFVDIGTQIINLATKIITAFNDLPEGLKSFINILAGVTAIAGPIIMITGVMGNFFGYIIKTVGALMSLRRGARGVFEFYTADSIAAKASTELLSKGMFNQAEATNVLKAALETLNLELAEVAKNMNIVASTSSRAMANQAAATASASAAVAAAGRGPSVSGMLGYGGRNEKYYFGRGGAEFSHYAPGSGMSAEVARAQTVGVLLGTSPAAMYARQYQQAMGTAFAPQRFYDPSQGSREAVLRQMAEQSGKRGAMPALQQMMASPGGASQAARLLPSRAEYDAYVAKYNASLRTLAEMGKKEVDNLTRSIDKAIAQGNMDQAEKLLHDALAKHKVKFDQFINEETADLSKINGTMQEVITAVGTKTASLEARLQQLKMLGYSSDPQSMFRFVSAAFGGGTTGGAAEKGQAPAEQRYLNALSAKSAVLEQQKIWGQRLSERQKKLADALAQYGAGSKQASAAQGQVTQAQRKLAALQNELSASTTEIVNAQKAQLRPALTELARSMQLNSKESDAYRGALMQLKIAQIKQIESAKLIEIAGIRYAVNLDASGNILNAFNLQTKQLITRQEFLELRYSQLSNSINQELSTMRISRFSRRKLDTWMNSLSNEIREQAVSHEMVRQANGRYVLALRDATGKVLAQSTAQFGGMGRGQKLSMGAGMAAGMGMMFMPMDGSGGTAAKIGGGALMGASMASMFGPPGLAIGAALGAALPILQAFQQEQQRVNDALISYGEALGGSSLVIDKFASEMGRLKPSEKLAAALGNIATPEKVMESGKAILETEAGQQLRDIASQYGGQELTSVLTNQLKQLTLLEIFTPQEAKDVAQTLAVELGNPMLGEALLTGINSVLDTQGNVVKDNISDLFMGTIPEIQVPEFGDVQNNAYKAAKSWTDEFVEVFTAENFLQEVGDNMLNLVGIDYFSDEEEKKAFQRFAQATVPQLASQLDKLREAQALVAQEFMSGTMTYDEYSSRMKEIQDNNIKAADALMKMKEAGAPVGAMLKDIADKAGRGEEFKQVEDIAKGMFDSLQVGERFLTQMQLAAAYGDINVGELQNVANLITDEETRKNLEIVFNVRGAEDNATEIIKLLGMGLDAEFIKTISIDSVEIGKPLADIYASLTAIAKLPPTVQKSVIADIQSDPLKMQTFISDFEYVQGLPDTKKGLYAEVFGNEDLTELRDNWDQFIALPKEERKTAILTTLVTGTYDFAAPPPIPTPVAPTEITMPDISSMLPSASGGGGAGGTDAIEKAYDRKIRQQDKIINQIQKEREERQKLLDLEKQALDFALRQQDLENQIARAKAEGRLADAALLQSQLDAEIGSQQEQERERLRQEEEDRRIKRAEREKKRLEKEKQKATDSSSGGGGGADDAATKEMEQRLQFLNDELQGALQGNVKILDDINARGADAFWDSKPISRYIEEAVKAGVPLETVKSELEKIFDIMVGEGFKEFPLYKKLSDDLMDIGVSGESLNKVLPNVFAILRDPNITRESALPKIIKLFESIGMNAQEAEKRAKRFLNMDSSTANRLYNSIEKFEDRWMDVRDLFSGTDANLISTQFIQGIRDGLTRSQILDNISKSIYDATFTKGINAGLDPIQATKSAESMSLAVKEKVNQQFDGYFKEIEINGKWNGIVNGQEVPPALRGLFGDDGKFFGTADTAERYANISTTVKVEPSSTPTTVTNSASNPLWIKSVDGNEPWRTPTDTRFTATGGFITRGTGGMIYGPGGPTDDLIPTMLSNGEYVIRASSVDQYGIPFLDMLNMGMLPAMGRGGYSKYPGMISRAYGGSISSYAYGGKVSESSNNVQYNIEVNVAGSNASPDEIANKVMQTIQRSEKMKGAVTRI